MSTTGKSGSPFWDSSSDKLITKANASSYPDRARFDFGGR
jgi:hypothetical protein